MPYAKPNRTSTTPRPPARRPKRPIDVAGPQNPTATIIEATGTWNFAARIWIAFDPRTSISPNWIDISGFIETQNPITITHGRSDGLTDVSATTCSLNVDLTDGRFFTANTNGPWAGLVGIGNWLRVDVYPPSGIVSTRFLGFTTSMPDEWTGDYQFGTITASDRFEGLSRARQIISMMQSELLTDPNLAGNIRAYWNLHESQGSTTFGDTSGNLSMYLSLASLGTAPGVGFSAANADGPGFDSLRCPTFAPVSTTQGTYLTAPVTAPAGTWSAGPDYTGLAGVLSFWYQATSTAQQVIASVVDTSAQFAFTIMQIGISGSIEDGCLQVAYTSTSKSHPTGITLAFEFLLPINDGRWHHIAVAMAATSTLGGQVTTIMYLDGNGAGGSTETFAGAGGNLTQVNIGAGYDPAAPGSLTLGAGNISDVSWYWGNALLVSTPPTAPPDFSSHYKAGWTGFAGESTDQRVARIARYAGIPIPLISLPTDSSYGGFMQRYNPIQGPWTNLAVGAHLVGTQAVAGRQPLDIMLEAARTEGMPLYENRSGYLEMQASTTRQNTTPAWTIDVHDLDPSTRLANDFTYTTNEMTISPNGQASQTVIGAAGSPGRLSQARFDVCDGSQATASVSPIEAQSLGLGIIQLRANPGPRLAPLAIEAASTALLPGYGAAWYDALLASEISTPVRVANAPVALGGGNYDVLLEGWTETITEGGHLFAFNVSPIQGPTYQLDDPILGRLDTDGTTLTGALNTVATTFTVALATTTSAAWTTAASDFPFDVLVDAEQMTVSAVAPVSIGVDGTFEASATGWTLSNCTFVQSTAQAHSGTHSGLMTALGAGAMTATTPQFAVNANATYQVNQYFLLGSGAPTADTVAVQWFTSGGASLGTVTLPNLVKPLSSWQLQQQAVTAPSTAAFATIRIGVTAAATGNTTYFDDISFPLLSGGQQQMTVTRSVNGVVASHSSGASLALAEPLTLAY